MSGAESLSPRLYEAIILCLTGIVSYFLVAAKKSMDDMAGTLKEIQISMAGDYVKKEDLESAIERLEEEWDKDLQLCQARNHKRIA